eukprot:4610015-Pleurochrysis_carterae.AAC.2
MESPRWAASDARVRKEVARIVAQKSRFERSTSFALIHPDKAYECSVRLNARSSRRACLRVLGSVWHVDARRTHPVLHVDPIGREAFRTESRAAGCRLRRGYAQRPRWKCSWSSGSSGTLVSAFSTWVSCCLATSSDWLCVPLSSRGCRFATGGESVRERGGDGSCKLDGVGRTELSVIRPATAFASKMFKSGGDARPANAGCRPGVHRSVVNFWAGDPNAHSGNRSAIDGKSQIGPCRACRNSGEARWPLSAGCSSRYSEPASRPARRSDAFALVYGRYIGEPRDVIPVADWRWAAVGDVGFEETAD